MGSGGRVRRQLILLTAAPAAVAAAAAGLDPRHVMAAAAVAAADAAGVDPSSLGSLVTSSAGPAVDAARRALTAAVAPAPPAAPTTRAPGGPPGLVPEGRTEATVDGPADGRPPSASWLAHRLGALHEALVPVPDRRRRGVHYTPPEVARRLVELALDAVEPPLLADRSSVVIDPACGGGAFLLAAAEALAVRGEEPAAVLGRLVGIDLDALAVDVSAAALALWAVSRRSGTGPAPPGGTEGVVRPGPRLVVGDALTVDHWGNGPVAAVVGNPPFGGQLDRRTARDAAANRAAAARLGAAAGYADTAALFLARALDEVAPGGAVALLQPVSVLGARDAAPIRDRTAEVLAAAWFPDGRVFAAGVDVVAPVLRRGAPPVGSVPVVVEPFAGEPSAGQRRVPRSPGGGEEATDPPPPVSAPSGAAPTSSVPAPSASAPAPSTVSHVAAVPRARLAAHGTWAPLWAAATGVPPVDLDGRGRLGDRCRATSGFRDEFYALAAVVHDDPDPRPDEPPAPGTVRVLTSGLVDPLAPAWGRRPARLAGRRLAAPVARLADVAASPERRLRAALPARTAPKVVVATQSRVVEVVVDGEGWWWPSVPLVAVTPGAEHAAGGAAGREAAEVVDVDELWLVAAALFAPPVTAWALHRAGGTALSAGAVKLSARQVLDVPLPLDTDAWREGSAALRAAPRGDIDALVAAGHVLTAAHGLAGAEAARMVDWWAARLPEVRP